MKCYLLAVLLLQYSVPSKQDDGTLKWTQILPKHCGISGMDLRKYLHEKGEETTKAPDENDTNRINRGLPAKISDNPWQVVLMDNNTNEMKCGGSIISKYHVLSATHCFPTGQKAKSNILVVFGTAIFDERTMSFPIQELYLHKHYTGDHHRNDIALIKIDGEFKWTPLVFPICLPSINESYASGRECVVSGFGEVAYGQSNDQGVLQYGIVKISTDTSCKRYNERKVGKITDGMFCASHQQDRKTYTDTCKGDSGGPLQCWDNDKKRRYLLGITSFGFKCGLKLYPGIYTKVVKYLPWIYDRVEHSLGHTIHLTVDEIPAGEDVGGPS